MTRLFYVMEVTSVTSIICVSLYTNDTIRKLKKLLADLPIPPMSHLRDLLRQIDVLVGGVLAPLVVYGSVERGPATL